MGLFHDIVHIKDSNLYHSNAILLTKNKEFFKTIPFKKELEKYLYIINISDLTIDGQGNIVGFEKRIADIADKYGVDDIHFKVAKMQYEQLQTWKLK